MISDRYMPSSLVILAPWLALWVVLGAGQVAAAAPAAPPQSEKAASILPGIPPSAPVAALQGEVERHVGELREVQKAQAQREAESQRTAAEIERLMGEPEGVGRDLRLQQLLAQAQASAADLSQRAAVAQGLRA